MGIAIVEIIEFTGSITSADEADSSTYLIAVNGEYPKSYGKPKYTFPPKSWRDQYQIASYRVGSAPDWKTFFIKCTNRLDRENPFSGELPGRAIRNYISEEYGFPEDGKMGSGTENLSPEQMDTLIDDLISL